MIKNLITLVALVLSSYIYCQTDLDFRGDRLMENMWFKTIGKDNLSELEGSPYFTKDFVASKISEYPDQVMTRYDMYNYIIEFLKNGKPFILPKTANYDTILLTLTGKKLKLIDTGYYFIVYEGKKYNVFKKIKSKFQPFEKAKNGYTEDKQAMFYNLPETFFIILNDKLTALPKNKNSFASLFPEKEKNILKVIKKNKINLNNEEGLRMIFQYIEN